MSRDDRAIIQTFADAAVEFDWSEYERLLGEFLRTYIEGENIKVADKLAALGGGATHLVRRRRAHKLIRDRISHWGHFLLARERYGPWQPCMVTVSFIAQSFLGLGIDDPVRLSIKGRDCGGGVTTVDSVKKAIGEMRMAAFVVAGVASVGHIEKSRKTPDGGKVMKLKWHPARDLPITHIKRIWDAEQNSATWVGHYDENAQGLDQWRELDQMVGRFFREWSEVLLGLRQLEIMMNNPNGPSGSLDISGKGTDMKRADKVLGRDHPIVGPLREIAKEKGGILLRGRRMIATETREAVIVDTEVDGGAWVVHPHSIEAFIESQIRPIAKVLHPMVDKRQTEWGAHG